MYVFKAHAFLLCVHTAYSDSPHVLATAKQSLAKLTFVTLDGMDGG